MTQGAGMSKHLVKIIKAEQFHHRGFGMALMLENNVKSKFIPSILINL